MLLVRPQSTSVTVSPDATRVLVRAGVTGPRGQDGAAGPSAYEVAVEDGFEGTEAEWLASLVGAVGADGADGEQGPPGENATPITDIDFSAGNLTIHTAEASYGPFYVKGDTGAAGAAGSDGADGENATPITSITYDGESLTIYTTDASYGPFAIKGETGEQGPPGGQGPDGAPGTPGSDGADGTNATPITSITNDGNGNLTIHTATDSFGPFALKGPQGEQGIQGTVGETGAAGADGIDGTDGIDGADGQGVPTGGTTNQVLAKNSATDFDTSWKTPGGASQVSTLPSDVVSSSSTLADVAGMTATLEPNATYHIDVLGNHSSSAGTEAMRVSISGTQTAANIILETAGVSATNAINGISTITAYDGISDGVSGPGTTARPFYLRGYITNGPNSSVITLRIRAETGGAANVTMKAGTVMAVTKKS